MNDFKEFIIVLYENKNEGEIRCLPHYSNPPPSEESFLGCSSVYN